MDSSFLLFDFSQMWVFPFNEFNWSVVNNSNFLWFRASTTNCDETTRRRAAIHLIFGFPDSLGLRIVMAGGLIFFSPFFPRLRFKGGWWLLPKYQRENLGPLRRRWRSWNKKLGLKLQNFGVPEIICEILNMYHYVMVPTLLARNKR